MKVLHVTSAYYPATFFGGPIFSTYSMCNSLASLPNMQLRVLTTDMAGPKLEDRISVPAHPMRYPAGYDVYFARRRLPRGISPGLLPLLWRFSAWADVIWLNGTYSFPTIPGLLASRLRSKPVVWSPRGALQASHEWGSAQRPVLKRAFERICRTLRPARCVLHVTAGVEREASLIRLPGFEAALIPNGVELPSELPGRAWQPSGVLRLMFISRLDPKKGLENLLRALAIADAKTVLSVYGTGDAAYVQSLKALTANLGIRSRVTFHGHADGDKREAAFTSADLFVFPTHSENFGMVVAEALARGVPAVVSRGAPWAGLEPKGCGLWVDNSPEVLSQAIDTLRGAPLAAMGLRGRSWMQDEFQWPARAAEMMALFERLLSSKRDGTTLELASLRAGDRC